MNSIPSRMRAIVALCRALAVGAALCVSPTIAVAATYFFGAGSHFGGISGTFTVGQLISETYQPDFGGYERIYETTNVRYSILGEIIGSAQTGQYVELTWKQGFGMSAPGLEFGAFSEPGEVNLGSVTASYNAPDGAHLELEFAVNRYSDTFADVFVDTLDPDVVASGTAIEAIYAPRYGLSLGEAAEMGGFVGFAWHQMVTKDPFPPERANDVLQAIAPLSPPYTDPPYDGYQYQVDRGYPLPDNYPFYNNRSEYDPDAEEFYFGDQPSEPNIGDKYLEFVTSLVALLPSADLFNNEFVPLDSFRWTSDYTGRAGGVDVERDMLPFDEEDLGEGGVTVVATGLRPSDLSASERALIRENGGRLAAVPEPSTWALMILGIGCVGAAFRNDRRKTVAGNAVG